ncbi:MAG: class V aminotransferase [candidate division NC10 bacterium RIFCSPLOWO2_12_FULL_66_18]|nr:MAG: class V aminotransferase [candidate division NC10 bacterium RIFCSPLOWO2_02_FULL_66_22]OGB97059.1 MAG: class V aminotransferase [candidate division NC10 bacterium RIFCSPLOWO2_12_FULL_66_18]
MKRYLLAPGPTPIPPEVLQAMAQPIIHHRAPEYEALFAEVRRDLRQLFQCQNEVLMFAASGTGAMEGAVVNTLSPGDPVVVVRGGKFGERWAEICEAYGVRVLPVDVPYGKSVDPAAVSAALQSQPGIQAVFATHSETSTGAVHDIQALAAIVRETPALLVVDAITSLGVMDLPMDAWGVDILVAGSQKALMLPPGLAFAALSDRAWAAVPGARLPKYYFNFAAERKAIEKNQSAYTPAVSLVVGLQESLRLILAEGLPNVFARHDRLARATRAGVQALGLTLFAEHPGAACTAVKAPAGIDGGAIVKGFRKRGITIAGGQGSMKGKIIRIAHMGYVDGFDVLTALGALELTLADLGYPVKLGEGVRAAQQILQK